MPDFTLRFVGVTASLICIAASATAEGIPRYDADGYCREVAAVSGGSAMIFNGCIEMEQTAYDALKASWLSIPGNARSYCNEVGMVSGGSYSILHGCIEMETGAASSPNQFRY